MSNLKSRNSSGSNGRPKIKCLHQGEYGVGYTIEYPEGFKQRLNQELMREATPDRIREPAAENVSPDGKMLRINLRALTGIGSKSRIWA
jgi:hypothetical protein